VILADSNVVLAAFDPRDPEHVSCQQIMRAQRDSVALIGPAVSEVAYFLERRAGPHREAAFLRAIASGTPSVESPILADYARAADLVEQYADFPLGTVDALLVAIAERLGVTRLLTLDRRHFGAIRPLHCEAFEILP
jgi:hypothetical protein